MEVLGGILRIWEGFKWLKSEIEEDWVWDEAEMEMEEEDGKLEHGLRVSFKLFNDIEWKEALQFSGNCFPKPFETCRLAVI